MVDIEPCLLKFKVHCMHKQLCTMTVCKMVCIHIHVQHNYFPYEYSIQICAPQFYRILYTLHFDGPIIRVTVLKTFCTLIVIICSNNCAGNFLHSDNNIILTLTETSCTLIFDPHTYSNYYTSYIHSNFNPYKYICKLHIIITQWWYIYVVCMSYF